MDTRGACTLAAAAGVMVAAAAPATAARLTPETVAAWDAYVRATEARIERELGSGTLAAGGADSTLRSGQVPIARMTTTTPQGRVVVVYGGMVHHWRGRVFVPGAALEPMLSRLANPRPADLAQDDVLDARVLEQAPDSVRVFLRLQRTQIVTAVYDTEHAVRFRRHGRDRASSRSVATRIAEIVNPGTPDEHARPPGDDRGFLWRLNAYWRYEEVPGGVVVECESISLSRTLPSWLAAGVRPIVDRIARTSLERTLVTMRSRHESAGLARRAGDGREP